jgi:hypothetical protein
MVGSSVLDPDGSALIWLSWLLIRIRIGGNAVRIQKQGNRLKFINKPEIQPFKKRLLYLTYVGMVKSEQDPDLQWFGSLYPDPDRGQSWIQPHWHECGSTTLPESVVCNLLYCMNGPEIVVIWFRALRGIVVFCACFVNTFDSAVIDRSIDLGTGRDFERKKCTLLFFCFSYSPPFCMLSSFFAFMFYR